jgi:hypothetical protein
MLGLTLTVINSVLKRCVYYLNNEEYLYSEIKFVIPVQRHRGEDVYDHWI